MFIISAKIFSVNKNSLWKQQDFFTAAVSTRAFISCILKSYAIMLDGIVHIAADRAYIFPSSFIKYKIVFRRPDRLRKIVKIQSFHMQNTSSKRYQKSES